ncbi:MAG: tetratricopeptide repeat protein [Anaerolineaceae bacterium]|nr:tetratricopeptide repeat protein [Anaerolineaceae bacterium]MDD4042932.1 tetratricopeptide repeat protein [Anaerolineaceae bacterium]MDD4577354.1 tetratricopeptide repeat protein [Anaerolineaceae bacterium]
MKKLVPFLILAIVLLGLFHPNGILVTVHQNIWSIDLVSWLQADPGKISQVSVPSKTPHSAVLLARQAIREEQLEVAQQILVPLLTYQDRAVQGTYAELLYAQGQKTEAFRIWENLNETIILERAANKAIEQGDSQFLLAANQSLYRLDPEKYTSSLAFTLKSQGQLSEAEDLLLLSRSDYPNSDYASDWLRYLADIYVAETDWQKAEQIYRQAIMENSSDGRAWRNLGLLYTSQLKMPEKAIECFQKMISLSPGETYGYSLLAQAYEKTGDIEKALQTYQDLLLVSPCDSSALEAVERLTNLENSTP